MPDQTFDEIRDPNMLYDDSDQAEFHESIADLVEGVRWDLQRYLFLKGLIDVMKDVDDPRACAARDLPLTVAPPNKTFDA